MRILEAKGMGEGHVHNQSRFIQDALHQSVMGRSRSMHGIAVQISPMSLKTDLGTEIVRNLVGLFLVIVGVFVIVLGAHWHMDVLVTLGVSTLIPAALLALQSKRTPDGNTSTTSVTLPAPDVAPAPIAGPAPK